MLIDKNRLIKELEGWKNGLGDRPEEDLVDVILKAVIDKVSGQPAAEVDNKWIPIDAGKPKDDNYILVSFENCSLPDIARYESDENGGAFYPGDDDASYVAHGLFVNAWQPLPESYKGE